MYEKEYFHDLKGVSICATPWFAYYGPKPMMIVGILIFVFGLVIILSVDSNIEIWACVIVAGFISFVIGIIMETHCDEPAPL
jgi:hypothetical protein